MPTAYALERDPLYVKESANHQHQPPLSPSGYDFFCFTPPTGILSKLTCFMKIICCCCLLSYARWVKWTKANYPPTLWNMRAVPMNAIILALTLSSLAMHNIQHHRQCRHACQECATRGRRGDCIICIRLTFPVQTIRHFILHTSQNMRNVVYACCPCIVSEVAVLSSHRV